MFETSFSSNYRLTGNHRHHIESSCVPFTQLPQWLHFYECRTTSKPGIWCGCYICVYFCHFITCVDLGNHHCSLDTEFPHHHRLSCASVTIHPWPSPTASNHWSVFQLYSCVLSRMLHKWMEWCGLLRVTFSFSSLDICIQSVACVKS